MNPKDVHPSVSDMSPKERMDFFMQQHSKFKHGRPEDIVNPPSEKLVESDGGVKRKTRTPRVKKPKVSLDDL